MIKRYIVSAQVVGIGKPIEKVSKAGKPYSYAMCHFTVNSKGTDGCSVLSTTLFDYHDLKIGDRVQLEIVTCGTERAVFMLDLARNATTP